MPGVLEVHKALAAFGVLEVGTGREARRIVLWGVSIGALVGLAAVAGLMITTVPFATADKAYWTVSGPPCPTATPAEIHRIGRPLAQVVEFGEGHFARISGAVECNDLTDGGVGLIKGTACQFSGPRALWVSSEGGSSYYDIRYGGPATVTVSRTAPPRCVLGAHFNGD
jgi:hypothetical protein